MLVVDTDVVIDVLRRHPPAIDWLLLLNEQPIALPGFVAMELVQRCANKTEQARMEQIIARYVVAWPSAVDCNHALNTFAQLRLSHGISLLDTLIAHTAIELDAPLATFNQKHYLAIPKLQLVQPYAH